MFSFIKKELEKGRQAYVIYPFIEESENSDIENLVHGYEEIQKAFPGNSIGMMHGRMKFAEREKTMRLFAENKIQILVATTVIEVGVNVPNASIIVIESSQKFGLSQLHQLRGRVGRSSHQSYCILMTPYERGVDARARINIMVSTNDGFEISEEDLPLRGTGDMMGTQKAAYFDFEDCEPCKR